MNKTAWKSMYFSFLGIACVLLFLRITNAIAAQFAFPASFFGWASCYAGYRWYKCERKAS